MTPEELAEMERWHCRVIDEDNNAWCKECDDVWPCERAQLVAVVRARDETIRELTEQRDALIEACELWAGDTSSDGSSLLPRRVERAIAQVREGAV